MENEVKISKTELLMMEHDFIHAEIKRIQEEANCSRASFIEDYSCDFMNFVRAISDFVNELIGEDI